jgi:hypothetical protein
MREPLASDPGCEALVLPFAHVIYAVFCAISHAASSVVLPSRESGNSKESSWRVTDSEWVCAVEES